MPLSVVEVAPVIRTATSSPGPAGSGEVHRGVSSRAPSEQVRVGPAWPLDKHLFDSSDPQPVSVGGDALDDSDQPLDTVPLQIVGNLLGESCGLGSGARRVDERERSVEADLLDDVERLPELLLRLAGEADDHIGRECQIGNGRPSSSTSLR